MAGMAAAIHDAPVAAPAFERWIDPARLTAPATRAFWIASVRPTVLTTLRHG
jgi:hypothetical protein